ncbi:hypothetical protein [Rouxiella badensis]|uniref:hypothetical protein n=1 Tax=Rouxiella badensis TaxID=1646377 RepID=UPI003C68FC90
MSVIMGKSERFRNYFPEEQLFNNELSDEKITLIIKAYKNAGRIEESSSSTGSRDFSPRALANAHYYRTVRRTLEHVLRLMATDCKEYDVDDFLSEIIEKSSPDISLILKDEPSQQG